jgi:hypothetical protein
VWVNAAWLENVQFGWIGTTALETCRRPKKYLTLASPVHWPAAGKAGDPTTVP